MGLDDPRCTRCPTRLLRGQTAAGGHTMWCKARGDFAPHRASSGPWIHATVETFLTANPGDRHAMTQHPQRLWHPFADMARVPGRELVFVRGERAWLEDDRGRRYLDAAGSLWYCNVGYGRAELADAAAAQMRALAAYSTFGAYANRPALELADRLAAIAPLDGAAVFFTTGGSDAVDTAGKMARRYWWLRGEPQRTVLVARAEAYHGMNAYGTSLAGIRANAEGWGPLVTDVLHVPHDDAAELERVLAEHGGRVAAFIGEPVIGAGGVIPPPDGYWEQIQRACAAHGTLLIADEVVTGYGRTGPWFGSERFGIRPDIVTTAKGLTSGYLPLGAVLCGPRVRDALWAETAGAFRHGYTYSGHAACCAVALANLDIIEREGLRDRVRALEPVLADALAGLGGAPLVEQTRSVGLLGAVQLSAEARAEDPGLADRVVAELQDDGILVRALVGHSLQISPPFVITEQEIGMLAERIGGALERVAATHGAGVPA
jgi:putrescine---pyruvate transaminase